MYGKESKTFYARNFHDEKGVHTFDNVCYTHHLTWMLLNVKRHLLCWKFIKNENFKCSSLVERYTEDSSHKSRSEATVHETVYFSINIEFEDLSLV